MDKSRLAEALRERLKEITHEVGRLEAERMSIGLLLGTWGEDETIDGDRLMPMTPLPISPVGPAVMGTKSDRIAEAARAVLSAIPGGEAPFLTVLSRIPEETLGGGPFQREYARTSLKRSGPKFGVVYEDADHVRLSSLSRIVNAFAAIHKSPEASPPGDL